jgi:DnaJ-class molecular chaperone
MAADWEQYDFYRVLGVEPEAGPPELQEAYRSLTSTLNPDAKPSEQKRAAAIAFITADAAVQVLSDTTSRNTYDSILKEVQKAQSEKEKIEASRAGKLQEQQSIEEDEQLKKAALKLESARSKLAEFYYEHLFKAARESRFGTVAPEKLVGWLSAERAESARKAEQEGRRLSFRIEMEGFAGVQEMRKMRSDEIVHIVDELVQKFQLP